MIIIIQFLSPLRELNTVTIMVRLCISLIFGGVVGYDRSRKRRPAGMKTHILVCLGATMTMLTNQYITDFLQIGSDPARMGAQVISGIGFLGAGTIMVTSKNQVRGLTTAAGLWACGCMGLAIGIGFYEGAFLCFFIVAFLLPFISFIEKRLTRNTKYMEIYVEFRRLKDFRILLDTIQEQGLNLDNLDIIKVKEKGRSELGALMSLKSETKLDHNIIMQQITDSNNIVFAEEL